MMQTMRRDTHLVKKVVGRFGDQNINSYDTIYISIGFNAFKLHYFSLSIYETETKEIRVQRSVLIMVR